MQYTIRDIPEHLDAALREAARRQGKSLNQAVLQALVRGAGLSEGLSRKRDLSDLAGSWQEDPDLDSALRDQDVIDESIWPDHQVSRKQTRKKAPESIPASQKRARGGFSS